MTDHSILEPLTTLEEGIEKIQQGLAQKQNPPADLPASLRVKDIYTLVSVFQPRKLDGRLAEDEAHIKALMDAIGDETKPRLLDPLVVWWGGSLGWLLVDGFHRVEAYKRLKLEELTVPVEVFSGTLSEAMAHAAACNSKDKLIMTKDEKVNTAWRLVLTSNLSKAKIADACKVAPRTVANMRAKVREIGDRISPYDLADKPWKLVNRLSVEELLGHSPKPLSDEEFEAWRNKKAEQFAKRLVKAFGSQMIKDPEAFARAIEIVEERLPAMLMETEAWNEHFNSLAEAMSLEDEEPLDF
jgi:uncharacterized phage-associated protein